MSSTPSAGVSLPLNVSEWRELYDRDLIRRENQRRLDEELAKASVSLVSYVKAAWHVLEPDQPYVHGWHIDAISEHLEAVTLGQILRLLVNVPPGTMKSLLIGVFWPTWEWGPKNRASYRYLGTSHALHLAIRDNVKCRRLVESEWYQERWPIKLVGDQNAKGKFENTATGFREAMAFTGMTGSRGHRVLIDDPISVDGAKSEADRAAVNNTFEQSVTLRLNDPKTSAIIMIMQRLHEMDPSGLIVAKDYGYEHLMLPMEFEPGRRCKTSIGFEDPRTKDGELLFPERFPREVVERDKKPLGAYGTAGQFQQRPAPMGGGMFKRGKVEIVDAPPKKLWKTVRGWDFASTPDNPGSAATAGVKMAMDHDEVVYVLDVFHDRLSPLGVDRALKNCASADGKTCTQDIPTDPGQAGKDSAGHRTRLLHGYTVMTSPESGSKEERAGPYASQWEAGNIKLVRGPWNDAYLIELESFPVGSFADQVDASSRAYNQLTSGPRPIVISDAALAQSKRPAR